MVRAMRVFVAGATGVIGKPLCKQLVAARHEVTALTRTERGAEQLRAAGAKPIVADVFDATAVEAAVVAARAEAVIHELTAIPAHLPPRQIARLFEPTNRLRTEGTRILLAAARAAGAKRFIAQSISFGLSPDGPSPAGEEPIWRDPPKQVAQVFAALVELEKLVTTAAALDAASRPASATATPTSDAAPTTRQKESVATSVDDAWASDS